MRRLPRDFADSLSPSGRQALEGNKHRLTAETPLAWIAGAIGREKAAAMEVLLEKTMAPHLSPLSDAIPPESIAGQTRNYQERLKKVARLRTAYLERRGKAWAEAERIGLFAMMRAPSFRQFAEAVAGRPLDQKLGVQVLRYAPGDYQGPHTDHHPEDPRAKDGYIDVHLSLPSAAVADQFLVYARDGHLSEMVNVAAPGGIAVYRLPFWHYTTPLRAKRGQAAVARRWVILGTFLYAR
ncbi:MAG: hypothetical protein EXQ89_06145 [Rhodospirillaceae bacterium]|nr:hypothetical protein [Rhodospirillaceae bacterium]